VEALEGANAELRAANAALSAQRLGRRDAAAAAVVFRHETALAEARRRIAELEAELEGRGVDQDALTTRDARRRAKRLRPRGAAR
jgi:hypothetical protein